MQKQIKYSLSLISLLAFISCGVENGPLEGFDSEIFSIGDTATGVLHTFEVPQQGNEPFYTYLSVHANESTSIRAAKKVVEQKGGRIVVLSNSKNQRLINISYKGRKYIFDPNRIYTRSGVRQTLEKYNNRRISAGVVDALSDFGVKVMKRVGFQFDLAANDPELLIALHNNTDGRYSLESYLAGGSEEDAAEDVFYNQSGEGLTTDPDDFYYLTSATHFQTLSRAGLNSVLQNNQEVPDDGSAAVFAGSRGASYINVEAQHGKNRIQYKMIQKIYELL